MDKPVGITSYLRLNLEIMNETVSYRIAGHVLSVSGDGVGVVMSKIHGFSVFRTEQPSEWTVNLVHNLQSIDFVVLHVFDFEQYDCHYGCTEKTDVLQIIERETKIEVFRLHYNRGDNTIAATYTTDTNVLRYALWFAFNLFAVPHKLMAIHSSTIVCNGKANLFLGESGTGKSTHTRLWLNNINGSKLLNDDSPVLAVEDDRIMVYGSPWSGKTPCYHNIGFPVNAFVRLQQAKQNIITKLSVFQAFAALQPSTPPSFSYSDFYLPKIIDFLDIVLKQCPIFQLACLPNSEAAELAYSTLYKQ